MAATYGKLYGSKGAEETGVVTRTGTDYVVSRLETWDAFVTTTLGKDGQVIVEVGPKYSDNGVVVYADNADKIADEVNS